MLVPARCRGDLAQVGLHDLFDGRFCFRLLCQNDLTNDRIDVCIGKFHTDGKPRLELFQVAGAGHGRLAGADKEQFAANVLAAGFHRLLLTSMERWLSSPMYCCTSSSTTNVSGNLPSFVSA